MRAYQKKYFVDLETIKSLGTYQNDGITMHWANNQIYAYNWHCPHEPECDKLKYGTFSSQNLTVECPGHHFKFSVVSGNNVIEALTKRFGSLETYDYMIEEGKVYIKIHTSD